jgi:hypothetical protein
MPSLIEDGIAQRFLCILISSAMLSEQQDDG